MKHKTNSVETYRYVEYASKIITGDWPIEKFDEFVEKWYSSGGQEVTDAARAWYNTTYQE